MRGKHGNHARGSAHPRWSDDQMISGDGYVKIRVGVKHPLADPNGYAYEHLLVWVSAGLPLPATNEILHHRDEVKTNNKIDNLELKTRIGHGLHHQPTALPDHEVREAREEYQAGDHTGILAKRHGVPIQTMWKIIRGKTRRDAGGPIVETSLRVGKARAGRLLDGVEHNAFPSL